MSQQKTLVVILCMHRCGSSLTARLFARLGMSLGPFELGDANPSNKYGHFEAQPFVLLNRELQSRQFGFEGDLPDDADAFRRFSASDGRWTGASPITDEDIVWGQELIGRLMESGDVCGFKDPRTVLSWPFWERVLATRPGLRVVPLVLLRGPHEIAMSIFARSQGERDYIQALDATAIHFRRMKEIVDSWRGPSAVVRFDPRVYTEQARRAAELCGLPWSAAALEETYDASCRHYEAVPIEHPAQAAFEALAGLPPSRPGVDDLRRLLADAAAREAILQQSAVRYKQQRDAALQECDWTRYERDLARHENASLRHDNAALQIRADMVPPLENRLAQAAFDLDLIRGSRTWRVHEALVGAMRFTRQNQDDPIIHRPDGQGCPATAAGRQSGKESHAGD